MSVFEWKDLIFAHVWILKRQFALETDKGFPADDGVTENCDLDIDCVLAARNRLEIRVLSRCGYHLEVGVDT